MPNDARRPRRINDPLADKGQRDPIVVPSSRAKVPARRVGDDLDAAVPAWLLRCAIAVPSGIARGYPHSRPR
jgi:hypothetical protein